MPPGDRTKILRGGTFDNKPNVSPWPVFKNPSGLKKTGGIAYKFAVLPSCRLQIVCKSAPPPTF
jgi:hypothetical protein